MVVMLIIAFLCLATLSPYGLCGTVFFCLAAWFMARGADAETDATMKAFKQEREDRRNLEIENARIQLRLYRKSFPRGEERGAAGDREAASPAADVLFINPHRRVH